MAVPENGNRASAMVVAVEQYDDPSYKVLKQLSGAAQELTDILAKGGYRCGYPELLKGGAKKKIIPKIRAWLQDASNNDTLILYWTGHGKSDSDGHYLITKDSPGKNLDPENALFTATLGKMVANSSAEKILILLDTCYSGLGAGDIAITLSKILATRTPNPGTKRAFAIIASAHPLKKAQEAAFCKALITLLAKGDQTRRWTDNDDLIYTSALSEALEDSLGEELGYKADKSHQRFIPNPRYRGAQPAEDVETKRLRLTMPEAEEHFLPASRGIDIGSSGWYFTGRERLLIELVKWLKNADHGMVVVTGPAGSGKSAVMGRVAILSDPHYRKIAEREQDLSKVPAKTLPPEGIINVTVHAKGKTLADCVSAIAAALVITLTEQDRNDPDALIEAVKGSKRRITILLDALDEAKPGHPFSIGKRLLKPLSTLSQIRVLVGTRRSPDGATIPEKEPRHGRLRKLFGDSARILDLEDELKTEEDIAEYVRRRLLDSRHQDDPPGVDRISTAVAVKAEGIFLYARVVVRTLEEVEDLDEKLPKDALDAFANDITRRFGDRAEMVEEMLCALAWGEGKGLSREVWVPVANALSNSGAHYTDDDVTWILKYAGWHIIEAGEEGEAVYRLPHQALADYYRNRFEVKDANSRITRALSEGIAGKEWLNADPYLWRHLASHAAVAGLLDKLVKDPGYLAVADPSKLVPVLSKVTEPNARDIVNIYRRTVHNLHTADPLERMALIHLSAQQEHPAIANAVEPPVSTAWLCRWAAWRSSDPHLVLKGHERSITSVALGEVDGSPVVVSGSRDTTVRLWDVLSGRALGEPFVGHNDRVTSVALGEVDGSPVVVSGSKDKTVRLWDARSGQPHCEPFTGHDDKVVSVALGAVDRRPVVVSSSNKLAVRIWDVQSRRPLGEPFTGNWDKLTSVALGAVDEKPAVVFGSEDSTVHLLDAVRGQPLCEPLTGHEGHVTSVAISEVKGTPVVVSVSDDETVRLWDARTGRQLGEPLTSHDSGVTSVALCEVDGLPVVTSSSSYGTVHLWDTRSGRALDQTLAGHEGPVTCVAVGTVGGMPVVVSGSDDNTVRLWDAEGDRALEEAHTYHDKWVTSAALGKMNRKPVVVSSSWDKIVRLYDATNGRFRGEIITGHESPLTSVALGEVDGNAVMVSGSLDNTVRLWDPHSGGRALGEPFTGHTDMVTSVALGEIDGLPVVISGSYDTTVRLWESRTGLELFEPLIGHYDRVTSVALGEVDGAPVVVSGSYDETVRLWDARTGRALGDPLVGHEEDLGSVTMGAFLYRPWVSVSSVALGEVNGIPVVISAKTDGKVRLWDARSRCFLWELLNDHKHWVTSVALGEVAGSPIVAFGSRNGTVSFSEVHNQQNHQLKININSRVTDLAFIDNSTIIVGTTKGLVALDINRIPCK